MDMRIANLEDAMIGMGINVSRYSRPIGWRKQFCIHGHDTFVIKRLKNGKCSLCSKEAQRKSYIPHPRVLLQFCKNGHDMAIVGRINHMCEVCRRDYEKQYAKDNEEKIKAYKEVYLKEHKEEIKEQRKKYVEANREKVTKYLRVWHLKKCYKLTLEQYNKILESQDFRCLGCLLSVEELGRPLTVDHDHNCCPGAKSCGKCIRGLLCSSCNVALGRLKDNVQTLKRLIKYLTK